MRAERRKQKPTNRMPAVLSVLFTLIYGVTIVFLMFVSIPEPNKDALLIMFGNMSTLLGAACAYYFNTTQSSKYKDQVIADHLAAPSRQEDEQ